MRASGAPLRLPQSLLTASIRGVRPASSFRKTGGCKCLPPDQPAAARIRPALLHAPRQWAGPWGGGCAGGVRGAKSKPTTGDEELLGRYEKKTQVEHILLRPDVYVGSMEQTQKTMMVFDATEKNMELRPITYIPGLLKIFDEILVNAADNKHRDANTDRIEVKINKNMGTVSIRNNGKGIPVVKHGKYNNIYIPELVMGNLLAGSNFDDDKARLVGGRHGYGAKLTNIFSSEFSVETADTKEKLHYKQVWKNNMSECVPPEIRPLQPGETDFTQVSFKVDLKRFKIAKLDQDTVDLWSRRVWDVAGCNPSVKCFLNSKRCKIKDLGTLASLFLHAAATKEGEVGKAVMVEGMSERWKVFVATNPGKATESGSLSFVNSVATTRGGTHLKAILDQIAGKALAVAKKTDTGLSVTDLQAKRAVFLVVAAQIENPVFDSQTKEQLVTTPAQFGSSPEISDKELKRVVTATGLVEKLLEMSRGNQDKELEKNVKKMAGSAASGSSKLRLSIPKLEDANWAGGGKSEQCTLILTEGDSAKALAVSGLSVLGRDRYGVFPLKGKLLNVREASHKAVLPPSHCLGITLQFTAPTMRLTAVHCPYHAANVCTHQPCG